MSRPPAETQRLFLPFVRRGIGAAAGGDVSGGRRGVNVRLTVSRDPVGTTPQPIEAELTLTARLHGPGDVVGLEPGAIVRTDPPAGTAQFEPNLLAAVELTSRTLPWDYTPETPQGGVLLRPWLVLLVLRDDEAQLDERRIPLPVLRLAATAPLPDLRESWWWAHAQVTSTGESVPALLDRPERSLARLLSPRRLEPRTWYVACVVPAFAAGVQAGLGRPVEAGAADAWVVGGTRPAELPVYHHWRFATGLAGDVEQLVRRLRPAEELPREVGLLPFDVRAPGPGLPPATAGGLLDVRGALRALKVSGIEWPETDRRGFEDAMEKQLEARQGTAPAVLAPPIYGGAHAGSPAAVPGRRVRPLWLRDLNVDPRLRVVASTGVRVVQALQEQLMSSAWEQAGALREANRLLREAQLSTLAGEGIQAKLQPLPAPVLMQVTQPAHARVAAREGGTLHRRVSRSQFPNPAAEPPFRRLTRPGGRVGRLLEGESRRRGDARDIITRLARPRFLIHAATALEEAGDRYAFALVDWDGDGRPDLVAVRRGTAADPRTGVRIYSGGSNFTALLLERETPLVEDGALWDFAFADRDGDGRPDLIAVKKSRTGTRSTEVHVLSGASEFQQFTLQTGTPLPEAGDGLVFAAADWDGDGSPDLLAVKTGGTASGRPEVLALSGASNFQQVVLQAGTALEPAAAGFAFAFADWNADGRPDLVAIKTAATGTGSTEVHVLSGASGFESFLLRTGTALEEAAGRFRFAVADWSGDGRPDLVAIKTAATGSGRTEVHVIELGAEQVPIPRTPSGLVSIEDPQRPGKAPLRYAAAHAGAVDRALGWKLVDDYYRGRPPRVAARAGDAAPVARALAAGDLILALPPDREPIEVEERDFRGIEEQTEAARLRLAALRARFRAMAKDHQRHLGVRAGAPPRPGAASPALDLAAAHGELVGRGRAAGALDPARAIRTEALARVPAAAPAAQDGDPLRPLAAVPRFPQPLYRTLLELAPELMLPGLEHVPSERLAILVGSGRFIEAFLVGVNHEIARELAWRGLPADPRATFARQFWDPRGRVEGDVTSTPVEDIPAVAEWDPAKRIGENATGVGGGEMLVLLVRGELVRRHPQITIYAGQLRDGDVVTAWAFPDFRVALAEDVRILGFPFTTKQARADPTLHFVFEEHVTAPRFGFDEAEDDEFGKQPAAWSELSWSHFARDREELKRVAYVTVGALPRLTFDDTTWGRDAAHMARIAHQAPVRVAVSAQALLPD